MSVRTRFAPSPTGYLHIGGARTALFCWAFARRHGGEFILRIEDTDRERSTEQSTQAILDSMRWLGLDWDEGPFYQMQRLDRYREMGETLLAEGLAYWAYESKEELEAMREAQIARGEKPRYNRRWRESKDAPPAGASAVLRFKNPLQGSVAWDDLVKGHISFENGELDDLVLLRADGIPTYNFGVVVDDLDMRMTHVIRGDDHVNNTPRQINLYQALDAPLPHFAHVPMILGHDGERLSKRHGAVSVMQYADEGYLPDALVNYLARLGWSHGDEEVFSRRQLIEWFDLEHISKSPARFDGEKLKWLNQQYVKQASDVALGELLEAQLARIGIESRYGPHPADVAMLLKERSPTLAEMAQAAHYFYAQPAHDARLAAEHFGADIKPAMIELRERFTTLDWDKQSIGACVKELVAKHALKMPKVAMPLRVMVAGTTQTPSIDATLATVGREETLKRMDRALAAWPA